MKNPDDLNAIKADVLRPPPHAQLSKEEVDKAVERHNREHPAKLQQSAKPAEKRGK